MSLVRSATVLGLAAALFLPAAESAAPAGSTPLPPPVGQKAEERFKNIQVLKGQPADDVFPAMQFISAALGVDCDHCHVDRAPEKDDLKAKQVARKMMAMTAAINRENFDGQREVTCNSCHRGSPNPVSIPSVGVVEREGDGADDDAKAAAPPPAEPVLDRYLAAVGGADALAKIKSRVETGTMTGFGPQPFPVEIVAEAPAKRVSTMKTPRGESITAFDGETGWLANSGRPARDMSRPEIDAARLDADFYFASQLKQRFDSFRVGRPETIDGKTAVRVVARKKGQPPVELYFDSASGLLVRMVRYAETPLGRLPTQVDYADYRATDGVTIPYRWSISRPGNKFEIRIEQVKQNVPIDPAKFKKPA